MIGGSADFSGVNFKEAQISKFVVVVFVVIIIIVVVFLKLL